MRSVLNDSRVLLCLFTSAAAFVAGCGDDSLGSGELEVSISGEDAVKEDPGFPFSDDGEVVALADGWSITFTKFIASIGNISLSGAEGEGAVSSSERYVADLHLGDPVLARFEGLPARRWERFTYELLPATAASIGVNGVDPADIDAMVEGGFNYWIEGSGSKDGETYTFAWGLTNATRNADCTNGADDKAGVVIRNNATATAEITVHADHLFWTSLGSEASDLRFEAIAAAASDDKQVTLEDLRTQRLSSLTGIDGQPLDDEAGVPVIYDPESTPLPSQDLRAFILASASSMGHLNGAGLCTVRALR